MKKYISSALLSLLLCGNHIALAQELIPTNSRLYEDLNWLNNRNIVHLDLSTWPLSSDEIRYELDHAKTKSMSDAEIVNRVRQELDQGNRKLKIQAEIQSERPLLPIGMEQAHDQRTLSAVGNIGNERFDANLQVNVLGGETKGRTNTVDLAGSYGGVKLGNHWLSVGQQSRYWGPGHEGSLILGDSARPLTAINLQRDVQKPFESKYLSWIGKWNYQLFMGQQLNSDYMKSPRNTKLFGMRVSVSPTDYLDIGASRVIQWGGEGRPRNWKTFGKAFLGKDNNYYNSIKDAYAKEPGNQLAGLDVKLKLQPLLGIPVSVYGQVIGEDEAGFLPSRNMFLAGIDGSHKIAANQTLNWHLEGADTSTRFGHMINYAYQHYIYRDGYFQQGMPLGYALGGDMRSVVLGINSSIYENNHNKWVQNHNFGGKLMYAQTVRKNKKNETQYKGGELFWQGDVPLKKDMMLQLGADGWIVKPENGKVKTGVSIKTGISF